MDAKSFEGALGQSPRTQDPSTLSLEWVLPSAENNCIIGIIGVRFFHGLYRFSILHVFTRSPDRPDKPKLFIEGQKPIWPMSSGTGKP